MYLVFTVCGVGVVHSRFGGFRLSATIIFLEFVLFYISYCQPIACFGAVYFNSAVHNSCILILNC